MLSDAEYNHLMRNWSVLKDQIRDMEKRCMQHHKMHNFCEAEKDRLAEEEKLYTDNMKDAIAEYQAARLSEEP